MGLNLKVRKRGIRKDENEKIIRLHGQERLNPRILLQGRAQDIVWVWVPIRYRCDVISNNLEVMSEEEFQSK